MRSLSKKITTALFINLTLVGLAFAAPIVTPVGVPSTGGHDINQVATTLYNNVYSWLTILAGALAVIYLIWNGILMITSNGDPAKMKIARQGVINAIIGIIVISSAFVIIKIATTISSGLNNTVNGVQVDSSGASQTKQQCYDACVNSSGTDTTALDECQGKCDTKFAP